MYDGSPAAQYGRKFACKLCRLRGGAYVACNDGESWVHVICALFARNVVRFIDEGDRWSVAYLGSPSTSENDDCHGVLQEAERPSPTGTSLDPLAPPSEDDSKPLEAKANALPVRQMPSLLRARYACYLCSPYYKSVEGVTVPCGACPSSDTEYMHITCGLHAGDFVLILQWQQFNHNRCCLSFARLANNGNNNVPLPLRQRRWRTSSIGAGRGVHRDSKYRQR